MLEIKPTVTRKLRRRTPEVPASLLMNRGSAGQVGSMVLGGVSGSSSGPNGANKFGYWADMQLYAPRWSPSPFKTTAAAPTDPLSPPDTALDENPPPSSAFAAHHQHHIPSNLFGSLGLNIDDGNCLVGHLVASLSMPGSVDGASIMNSMLTQHSGNNSCSSVASVAAAIVPSLSAGFMAPKRQKKNSSQPMTQLSLLLSETDIYSDLTSIHRSVCGVLLLQTFIPYSLYCLRCDLAVTVFSCHTVLVFLPQGSYASFVVATASVGDDRHLGRSTSTFQTFFFFF